jgi:hypothetical protein
MKRPGRSLPILAIATFGFLMIGETGSADDIRACISKRGKIRVVEDHQRCRPWESETTLSTRSRPPELRVFDGDGNDLGIYAGRSNSGFYIYLEDLGVNLIVWNWGEYSVGSRSLWFGEEDCGGTAYIEDRHANLVNGIRTPEGGWRFFVAGPFPEKVETVIESVSSDGSWSCNNNVISDPVTMIIGHPIDLEAHLGVTFPLTTPLTVRRPVE